MHKYLDAFSATYYHVDMTGENNKGFTLIELSIVLVIIGLIVGGILNGNELIRVAEIRATISQEEGIAAAVFNFRNKYNGLPGDLTNATKLWGALDDDPVACLNTPLSDTLTCNGDGNGHIEVYNAKGAYLIENRLFWQQLYNAKLINGSIFFPATVNACDVTPSNTFNVPSRIPSANFTVLGSDVYTDVMMSGTNFFILGSLGEDCLTVGASLRAKDAFSLDSKLDDGIPNAGRVITITEYDATNCRNPGNPKIYDFFNIENKCSIYIAGGF